MKAIGLFTRRTWKSDCWAFHQAIYHQGQISIAMARPLIREFYFGLIAAIKGAEVFVFHAVDDYALLRNYLPELPPDNFIQMDGQFDLFTQMSELIKICREVDFDSPFIAVPLDHVAFTPHYYQALNASMVLAERSGSCSLLGDMTQPANQRGGVIIDKGKMLDGPNVTASFVERYIDLPSGDTLELENPLVTSWDCGVFGWRSIIASRHLEARALPTQDNERNLVSDFHQMFDFNSLASFYVIKGTYGWFKAGSEGGLELVPYGHPDRSENVYIGSVSPAPTDSTDWSELLGALGLADGVGFDMLSDPLLSIAISEEDNALNEIDLRALEELPGLSYVARVLRKYLESR